MPNLLIIGNTVSYKTQGKIDQCDKEHLQILRRNALLVHFWAWKIIRNKIHSTFQKPKTHQNSKSQKIFCKNWIILWFEIDSWSIGAWARNNITFAWKLTSLWEISIVFPSLCSTVCSFGAFFNVCKPRKCRTSAKNSASER